MFVRERMQAAGYEAVPQVGIAGYFIDLYIDLAVCHPDRPGTFLLGVECDGAGYHSSRSARDRDILGQQILEEKGWKVHRIWSTDRFRDPAGKTRGLVDRIERLRDTRGTRPPAPAGLSSVTEAPGPQPDPAEAHPGQKDRHGCGRRTTALAESLRSNLQRRKAQARARARAEADPKPPTED